MTEEYLSLLHDWAELQDEAKNSPRLLLLKQFRDDFFCIPGLSDELRLDPFSVLRTRYPGLDVNDIYGHVSHEVQHSLGNEYNHSYESTRLFHALNIDKKSRQLFRSLAPLHPGWRSWRSRQMKRFASEDCSIRSDHIMHIPFAIELTQGCSGGCSFCGLSASYLEQSESSFELLGVAFTDFLLQMKSVHGEFGKCGILYWATDPLDCVDYLQYAEAFRNVFNVLPSTTTALAAKYPHRFKAYIDAGGLERPWGLRCSLRSLSEYKKISDTLSLYERFSISFITQYREYAHLQAITGRSYDFDSSNHQQSQGGTIACMSGLLVSLPRLSVELITPCLAEPHHQNGYRSLLHANPTSACNLTESSEVIINQLPNIPFNLNDDLTVTIHPSQYLLYKNPEFPDLLNSLAHSSRSLQQIVATLSDRSQVQRMMLYCLELIQFGVLKTSVQS